MAENGAPLFHEIWDYSKPAETEQRFREMLPEAEAAGDPSYLAQLLTQLARTQGLQRRFDAAHEILDRVEANLAPDLTVARIRYQLERGRTFNSSGEKERARPLFVDAWEMASAAGEEFHAVDAAHMMGIAGETAESQLEWNLKAVEAAEKASSPRARQWLGSLYNNIGWTYHDMGDYEQALATFRQALRWREEAIPKQPVPIRIAKWCVARTLRSLNRLEEALVMQKALLAEWDAAGGEQDGFVFEELGECLLALGREEEARSYFAQAYNLLAKDAWLVDAEPERLQRLQELGRVAD